MSRSIALHLGTHKSASTYLTFSIELSEDLLRENSVYLASPTLIRQKYNLPHLLNKTSRTKNDYSKELTSEFARFLKDHPAGRVIISEENFLGYCNDFEGSSALYPHADKNFKILSSLLKDEDVTIYLCVRNLKSFLPSAYCEYLRNTRKLVDFRSYISNLNLNVIGWHNFVRRVHKAFPNCKIKVWDFESIKTPEKTQLIIQDLINTHTLGELPLKRDKVRPAINKEGIDLLVSSYKNLSQASWEDLRRMLDNSRLWTEGEKFNPWTHEEETVLDQRHTESLLKITKISPNIDLL